MVDLLVLTSSDGLLNIKNINYLFTKLVTLMRRSNVLNLSPQLVFPASDKATLPLEWSLVVSSKLSRKR